MTQEKSSQEVLSEKLDQFFPAEEVKEQPKIEEPVKTEMAPNPLLEEMEEEEAPQEEQTEEEAETKPEEKQDSEKTNDEIKRKLSGYPKEFRDLVESVQDNDLKAKVLEAGKVVRAREDRLSLELGNLKKEHNSVKSLIQMIDQDPVNALKHIAKVTKVDLASLIEKPVQEEDAYDYRTPEEIARDKQLEDIKRQLEALTRQKNSEEHLTIEEEISDFAKSEDSDGNLKYPHFEKLESIMFDLLGLDNQKLGYAKTAKERRQRLESAYNRAIRLDDELFEETKAQISKKEQERKKEEIEKAKKLKKFTGRSSVSVKPASSRDSVAEAYDRWQIGAL